MPSRTWSQFLATAWSTPLRRAFLVTGVWRVLVACWGIASHAVSLNGPDASQTLSDHGWAKNIVTLLVDAGVREDSWWYARIATHGYTYSTTRLSSIVFYPLFPGLIKAVAALTGNVYVAGMLIPTICLFGAVYFMSQWLTDRGMADKTAMSMALMLCFPFGFFWASMYTESLFLVLTLATFVFFERERYLLSSLCVFLAVLSRPTGLIIAPALALTIVFARRGRKRQLTSASALSLKWLPVLAGPFAYAVFSAYQWIAFGTPFASIRAEAVPPFSRGLQHAVSDLLLRRHGFPPWYLMLMLVIALTFLAATPMVYRRFGAPYALFSVLTVLFPLASGLTSMERYVLVDFPVFAAVATIKFRWIPVGIIVAGSYCLMMFMMLFVQGFTLI